VEIGAAQAGPAMELLLRDRLQAKIVQDLGARDRAILLTWA